MARLLVYYAHPGERFSHVNIRMKQAAEAMEDITFVDLYREYPRFNINVTREQDRLKEHDIILFQFPFFWYSTPSIIKEWQDLVLEHGFAYGAGGDALKGKMMMLAVTAAGPVEAYDTEGYNHFPVRMFLSPLEQTARLCKMSFAAPYFLFSSLRAPGEGQVEPHVEGYERLLRALCEDRLDIKAACTADILTAESLPLKTGG